MRTPGAPAGPGRAVRKRGTLAAELERISTRIARLKHERAKLYARLELIDGEITEARRFLRQLSDQVQAQLPLVAKTSDPDLA